MYCWIACPPPAIATSFSPAAAVACSSAVSIPSVTKWKVVPPSISSGSRSWWVRTKTGTWKGGSSPHQPRQGSSPQGPGPPPNMLRPIRTAPTFPDASSKTSVLALTSPPSRPWARRQASSFRTQSCSASPPSPSGFSALWLGPATKPSRETLIWNLRFPTAG